MKKLCILITLLCCLLNYSCDRCPDIGSLDNYYFENNIEITDEYDAIGWIKENIKLKYDIDVHKVADYWQLPETTVLLGTGDCEDIVILFMYLLKTYLNIDSYFVGTLYKKINQRHAIVYFNNDYYDLNEDLIPINIRNYDIIYILPYGQTLWETYSYHYHRICTEKFIFL